MISPNILKVNKKFLDIAKYSNGVIIIQLDISKDKESKIEPIYIEKHHQLTLGLKNSKVLLVICSDQEY